MRAKGEGERTLPSSLLFASSFDPSSYVILSISSSSPSITPNREPKGVVDDDEDEWEELQDESKEEEEGNSEDQISLD